jgi:hypothetical protein
MSGFEQDQDTVGKVASFMVDGWFLLESAKDQILGVDPPMKICSTTCPVWNSLLTNQGTLGMCLV